MNPSLKIRTITKSSGTILSVTALSILSVTGCAQQQPPSAVVSPTQSAQTAKSTQQTQSVASHKPSTLKNLQSAYNGESNAHVMYLAFAKKADEEGYKEVARLFQAAARAEAIHRDNHAKVIKQMGATPQNRITTPEVQSTQENLDKAIKGESYERDEMYPEFIKQANADGNKDAVQTLTYAFNAETQHAQLYTQAKNNLNAWREVNKPLYVCTASGETSLNLSDTASCPKSNAKEQFEKIG